MICSQKTKEYNINKMIGIAAYDTNGKVVFQTIDYVELIKECLNLISNAGLLIEMFPQFFNDNGRPGMYIYTCNNGIFFGKIINFTDAASVIKEIKQEINKWEKYKER